MREFVKRIKFEHVMAFTLLGALISILFLFKKDTSIVTQIITAIVGAFSALMAYLFTKYTPNQKQEVPRAPQVIEPSGSITEMR